MSNINFVLLVLLVYLTFIFCLLSKYNFNPTSFANLGENTLKTIFPGRPLEDNLPKGALIFRDVDGYDGQYYYLIARNPINDESEVRSPYRQSRIVYPIAAKLLSLGQDQFLPWAMIIVNLAAVAVAAVTFKSILGGKSILLTFLAAFNPGFILGLQYDLSEPLSLALSLGAVYFYLKKRILLSMVFITLGLFTRESAGIFLLAIVLNELYNHQFKNALKFILTLAPFIAYQALLSKIFSTPGINAAISQERIGFPLEGIFLTLQSMHFYPLTTALREGSVILIMVLVFLCGLYSLRLLKSRFNFFAAGALLHFLFAVLAGVILWGVYLGAGRVFAGIIPFTLAINPGSRGILMKLIIIVLSLLSIFTFLRPFIISPAARFYIIS